MAFMSSYDVTKQFAWLKTGLCAGALETFWIKKKINKWLGLEFFFFLFQNGKFSLALNQSFGDYLSKKKWIYDKERGFWRLPWLRVVITYLNGVLPRMDPGKQTLLYELQLLFSWSAVILPNMLRWETFVHRMDNEN